MNRHLIYTALILVFLGFLQFSGMEARAVDDQMTNYLLTKSPLTDPTLKKYTSSVKTRFAAKVDKTRLTNYSGHVQNSLSKKENILNKYSSPTLAGNSTQYPTVTAVKGYTDVKTYKNLKKDFGAVGDGVASDDAAIQSAFDYLGTYEGALLIPPGTYKYSTQLELEGNNIEIIGANAVFYNNRTANATSNGVFLTGDNIRMHGLKFDSNGYADWVANGDTHKCSDLSGVSSAEAHLVIYQASNVYLENNIFTNSGCWNIPVLDSSYVHIKNNTIKDSAIDGINMYDGSHHIEVVGNIIENTNDDAISMVWNSVDTNGPPAHFLIADNLVTGSKSGVACYNCTKATIKNNGIYSATSRGILVRNWDQTINDVDTTNFAEDVVISGNTIKTVSGTGEGISVTEILRGRISGNTVDNTGTVGIGYGRYSDLLISNNTIKNFGTSATARLSGYSATLPADDLQRVNNIITSTPTTVRVTKGNPTSEDIGTRNSYELSPTNTVTAPAVTAVKNSASYDGSGTASMSGPFRNTASEVYNIGATDVTSLVANFATGGTLSTANVTNLYLYQAQPFSSGSGTVTNLLSFFSDPGGGVGTFTNKYHFYGNGNYPSYFGGLVESASGGFKYPDGVTQPKAAVPSGANNTVQVNISGVLTGASGVTAASETLFASDFNLAGPVAQPTFLNTTLSSTNDRIALAASQGKVISDRIPLITATYMPRMNAAGTAYEASQVISNSTGIGVGSAATTFVSEVNSSANATTAFRVYNSDASGASATGQVIAKAEAAQVLLAGHGTGRTSTRYGVTLGGYSEVLANIGNGLLIGTGTTATPIVFGTNGTKRMEISSAGVVSVPATGTLQPVGRLLLPMGEISYFSTTGTTVTISAASDGSTNMVKAAPTTELSAGAFEFDNGGSNNGRLRYTGAVTKMFHAVGTVSIAPAAANDTFVVAVAKNGTVIASSRILMQAINANAARSSAMHVLAELATNDYLEIYVGNTTDADDCNVLTMNMFAMGM